MLAKLKPIIFSPPGWILRSSGILAALDLDFVNDRGWAAGHNVSITSLIACTRTAITGGDYYTKADGSLTTFGTNALRYGTNGLLAEDARTNVVLWSRDLTNAVWTASNCTVAKNQTGNDGTANGASSLTATAGNATVLQAITLASSARFQSAWVKRLTGTGTINMTTDNGSTWGAIVPTSSWTQLTIPTQTLANPTVGFRIVTSGDAIAVDYVQNENSALYATSPIPTTTVAVTRAAETLVGALDGWHTQGVGTLFASVFPVAAGLSGTRGAFSLNDGSGTNRVDSRENGNALIATAGVNQATLAHGSFTNAAINKVAVAYTTNDMSAVLNGGAVATDASGTIPTVTRLQPAGLDGGNANNFGGYVRRVAYWNVRLPDAAIKALTTLP